MKCSIFVSKLPKNCTRHLLEQTFAHFGALRRITFDEQKAVYAIIQFEAEASVGKVFDSCPVYLSGTTKRLIIKRRIVKDPTHDFKLKHPDFIKRRETELNDFVTRAIQRATEVPGGVNVQLPALSKHVFGVDSKLENTRQRIVDFIKTSIERCGRFDGVIVEIFGSVRLGLSHRFSDLDFTLLFPANAVASKCDKKTTKTLTSNRETCMCARCLLYECLQLMQHELSLQRASTSETDCNQAFKWMRVLDKARVPILRCFCPSEQIYFDVSINNRHAITNNQLMLSILDFDPVIRDHFALMFVIFLANRKHTDFNSYTMFWLIIFHLQRAHKFPGLKCFLEGDDVGDTKLVCCGYSKPPICDRLASFLEFYRDFDFVNRQIDLLAGEIVIAQDRDEIAVIKDPLDSTHNIAKCVQLSALNAFRNKCGSLCGISDLAQLGVKKTFLPTAIIRCALFGHLTHVLESVLLLFAVGTTQATDISCAAEGALPPNGGETAECTNGQAENGRASTHGSSQINDQVLIDQVKNTDDRPNESSFNFHPNSELCGGRSVRLKFDYMFWQGRRAVLRLLRTEQGLVSLEAETECSKRLRSLTHLHCPVGEIEVTSGNEDGLFIIRALHKDENHQSAVHFLDQFFFAKVK